MICAAGAPSAFGEDSGDILLPMNDSSPSPDSFSVSLRKAKKVKTEIKAVQLIKPGQNSQFTAGQLNFNWKVRSDAKKNKMKFVLENLDSGKAVSKDVRSEQLSVDLKPGNYRWRLVSSDPKVKSAWRAFEIIQSDFDVGGRAPELNIDSLASQHEAPDLSHRDVASTTADDGKVDSDTKLNEYRKKKELAEQEASDLEKRVKSAEIDAQKAMQVAKEQQARLKAVRLEKAKEEKLAKERFVKLEAARKEKMKQEEQARIRHFKKIQMAKVRLQEMNKRLRIKLQEAKDAKIEADRAASALAALSAPEASESERDPADQDDSTSTVQEE